MAYHTYTCEKYIIYIKEHQKIIDSIYALLLSAPITQTEIGKVLNYDFLKITRRLKKQTLKIPELIKALEFIK